MEELPPCGDDYVLIQPVPTRKYAIHGHVTLGARAALLGPLLRDAPEKAVTTARELAAQNGISVVYVARRMHACH